MTDPVIICDTRERTPWQFPPEIKVERRTLSEGDYSVIGPKSWYSIEGFDRSILIERKSLGDFVSTVVSEWTRFAKELHRLMAYDCAAIVVEANVGDVIAHRYESQVEPAVVEARAHQCFIDFGVPVMWWGPREEAQVMALRFLKLAWKRYGR